MAKKLHKNFVDKATNRKYNQILKIKEQTKIKINVSDYTTQKSHNEESEIE